MGLIRIEARGSFPDSAKVFSAQEHGHARAVADAIAYLSSEMLPLAIAQDQDLAREGAAPSKGFGGPARQVPAATAVSGEKG